jgi:hypothetical protein
MAVGASSAQAETGAYWLVNGAKFTTLLPELTGTLENDHGVLLGSIAGVGIHILCTAVTFVAGGHLVEPNGSLLGKVSFSGCKILRLKSGVAEPLAACTPPGGIIETTTGKGLIVLSGGSPVTVLEPSAEKSTLFATITTGEECAFGEKITINGKLGVKDAEFLKDLVTHLITEDATTTELYINGNKANAATIDGSANISLIGGTHKGLTWSGHPA